MVEERKDREVDERDCGRVTSDVGMWLWECVMWWEVNVVARGDKFDKACESGGS